jgi:hypothetical protein
VAFRAATVCGRIGGILANLRDSYGVDSRRAGDPNRPLRQQGHREHHDQLSAIGVSYFTQEVSSLGNTPAVLPKAFGPTVLVSRAQWER